MHYIFVINGRKDFAQMEVDIRKQLDELTSEGQTLDYTLYRTTGVGDATRYTRIYCDLHRDEEVCFVACGGCGIFNEVASGIVNEANKSMAVLAYGNTNDFIKYYPDYDFRDVRKMLNGTIEKIDIIQVNDNYSLNVCDFGMDSIVASEANYLAEDGKSYPYYRGLIRGVIAGRYNHIQVIADGKQLNKGPILSCALANGRYVGGGFYCAPHAINNDGLMDICLIKSMSLISLFFILGNYIKGLHTDGKYKRKVIYTKAKHVDFKSKSTLYVILDGEILPGTEFSADILPQAIRLVLPEK